MGFILDWIRNRFHRDDPTPPAPQPEPQPLPDDFLQEMLKRHNYLRRTRGLPELRLNDQLCTCAQRHAQWMSRNRMMAHAGFPARLSDAGYGYQNCGENIAAGQTMPEEVMASWMGSPGHRRNILGDFVDVGFGRVGDYWCVDFGTKGAIPTRKTSINTRGNASSMTITIEDR